MQTETLDVLTAPLSAAWRKSPAIRAEFGDNFASFSAFFRAQTNGRVRIKGASQSRPAIAYGAQGDTGPGASAILQTWNSDSGLRSAFCNDVNGYVAFCEAAG